MRLSLICSDRARRWKPRSSCCGNRSSCYDEVAPVGCHFGPSTGWFWAGPVWLGANPSRSDPRSGCLLRRRIRSSRSLARHSRSSDVCTLALAERVCGATDRFDPPGMPGPHCGDRGAAPAPYSQVLHGVLQRGRTHLSLGKDAPIWRDIQCAGRIEVRPVLCGLHHQYMRI